MNLTIDDKILIYWEKIPESFTIKDLMKICQLGPEDSKRVKQQVYRMNELGIVSLGAKTWHKNYIKLSTWFDKYIRNLNP